MVGHCQVDVFQPYSNLDHEISKVCQSTGLCRRSFVSGDIELAVAVGVEVGLVLGHAEAASFLVCRCPDSRG